MKLLASASGSLSVAVLLTSAAFAPALLMGCDAFAGDDPSGGGPPSVAAEAGPPAVTPPAVQPGGPDADVEGGGPTDASVGDADTGPCMTTFRYLPSAGAGVKSVAVTGEWNDFSATGVPMKGPDPQGAFTATVELKQGFVGYKLLLDGAYTLDPASGLRKYVNAVENSAVRVGNCRAPTLSVATHAAARPSAGQGHFTAAVLYKDGQGGPGIDPATVKASLRKDGASTPVAGATFDAKSSQIAIDVPALADGKYTVFVEAADKAGAKAKTLRLVFWIENAAFAWNDAFIYMAMVDRFKDGAPSNNATPTSNVDPRADFMGGDLQGVRAAIANGTFDQLGVRALWLSPFHANPTKAYLAGDGVHMTMGYHGYWPVKAREVDSRIGGDQALKDLVKEAHAHGIRVLQDFVVNHVHKEHEYFTAHPSWFRTGCVCGTNNCDWTSHRLDCLFSDYLPDVNWTVPEVSEQYSADAIYWLDNFDIDGLRVDAVKHVEDLAVMNMTTAIRQEFEAAGTRVFLTGETAMGWGDCGLACNAEQYGTINRYMGPFGLDGQADFVLYHAVAHNTFSSGQKGMLHAAYWGEQSSPTAGNYTANAIMTPYIGSHDTSRFATTATYRGQDGAHDPGIPNNQWTNYAGIAPDAEAHARQRTALSWLLGLPGAPMIYYGDEYGEGGGADPNNRVMWRGDGSLNAEEQATLARTRALGTARRDVAALRRGVYKAVPSIEDVLVYARQISGGDTALVAISRLATATTYTAQLPTGLLPEGAVLHDRLGGADVHVNGGAISVSLPARGAAILAP